MKPSVYTKEQTKTFVKTPLPNLTVRVTLRYDDKCGNGHNSFGITGTIWENNRESVSGVIHEEITKYFPELSHLIKYHSMSSDCPLHYVENTLFFLGFYGEKDENIELARKTAIWPDLPEKFLKSNGANKSEIISSLTQRLPALKEEFAVAMEKVGFVY